MRTPATDRKRSNSFEKPALLSASATVLISVLGLLGWGLGLAVLTSVRPSYIPIALSTCLALLVQGTILIVHIRRPSHARRWPCVVLVAVTAILGMLALVGHFVPFDMNFEGAMLPSSERFAQFPVNRMSPLTGVLVFIAGTALLLLLRHKTRKLVPHLAAGLASLVATVGLIGTVGYVYGTPLLYVGAIIPMALTTSVAFMFLGTGLVAAAGPDSFLLKPLTGGSVRAKLLRTFAPLGFIAVLGSDVFQHLVTRLNDAVVAGASAVFFGMATIVVVVKAARVIGGTLEKAEAERKKAEDAAREFERRFGEMLETVKLVTVMLDRSGNITFCNDFLLELTGWKRDEATGKNWFDFFLPPSARDEVRQIFDQSISSGVLPARYENEIQTRSGKYHRMSWNNTLMRDLRGEIIGMTSLGEDVTTRTLFENRLRQAEKLEALGTLTGGIAHDFNNILTAIMGFTEMSLLDVPDVPKDSRIQSNLSQVLKAAHRAKDLIAQILTFSRTEKQERKPIDIGPSIEEALKLLRASLPTTIEIRQEISISSQSRVLADSTQIHQVLMNLCTNAAHAMREKGGILSVSLSEVVLDSASTALYPGLIAGNYLRLAVSDTGHGIDRATKERIFEPFFTTKGVREGTGMGLAVVHGIVKSHGGAITVYSEPGRGSTFHLYFPRLESSVAAVPEVSPDLPRGKERILIVDDEMILTVMEQQMLELLGYHVVTSTSSIEALEIFRANPERFDLVLTDYTMPHMTGVELAKELMLIRSDIPVVMCSGFTEMITEETARSVGIREFILKPLSIHRIAGVIRKALDAAQSA